VSTPTDNLATLVYNVVIPKDSDWPGVAFPILNPDGSPAALAGCTALGEIRPFAGSDELYYTWSTTPTTGQGLITLDAGASTLTIRVLAAESALWAFTRGAYDIVLLNPAASVGMRTTRVVMGTVTVSEQATLI
jgi:hypothetical protein